MTPPEAPATQAGTMPPAVSVRVATLKKRADFVRAARAKRQGTKGVLVQARARTADEPQSLIRVGFTCSKKVGNAVARNRAKRRLREAARKVIQDHGRSGWDYVLIGRAEATANRPFDALCRDLIFAINTLHDGS